MAGPRKLPKHTADSITNANRNLPWVDRYLRGNKLSIPDVINPGSGKRSTHALMSGRVDDKYVVFPRIVQQGDSLVDLGDKAFKYAIDNNTLMYLPDSTTAELYSKNGLIDHTKYPEGGVVKTYTAARDKTNVVPPIIDEDFYKPQPILSQGYKKYSDAWYKRKAWEDAAVAEEKLRKVDKARDISKEALWWIVSDLAFKGLGNVIKPLGKSLGEGLYKTVSKAAKSSKKIYRNIFSDDLLNSSIRYNKLSDYYKFKFNKGIDYAKLNIEASKREAERAAKFGDISLYSGYYDLFRPETDLNKGLMNSVSKKLAKTVDNSEYLKYVKEDFKNPGIINNPKGLPPSNSGIKEELPLPYSEYDELNFLHGSPHPVRRLTVEKPYNGEGAQAYGPGLYFSDDPNVHGFYLRPFGYRVRYKPDKPFLILDQRNFTLSSLPESIRESFAKDWLEAIKKRGNSFFQEQFNAYSVPGKKLSENPVIKSADFMKIANSIDNQEELFNLFKKYDFAGTRYKGQAKPGYFNYTLFDEDYLNIEKNNYDKYLLESLFEDLHRRPDYMKKKWVRSVRDELFAEGEKRATKNLRTRQRLGVYADKGRKYADKSKEVKSLYSNVVNARNIASSIGIVGTTALTGAKLAKLSEKRSESKTKTLEDNRTIRKLMKEQGLDEQNSPWIYTPNKPYLKEPYPFKKNYNKRYIEYMNWLNKTINKKTKK